MSSTYTSGRPRITDMSIRTGLVLQGDVCEVKIMVGKMACNFYPRTSVIFTDMVDSHGTKFTDVRGSPCKTNPVRIGLKAQPMPQNTNGAFDHPLFRLYIYIWGYMVPFIYCFH